MEVERKPIRRSRRELWRIPGVSRLLAGNAAASTARWSYNVALPAYIYGRTHSAGYVAFVSVARYLPALMLTPLTAQLAHFRRRRVLLTACDSAAAIVVAVMALIAHEHAPIAAVIVLAAICSTATRARGPIAAMTLIDLVGEDWLIQANVGAQTTESAAVIAGPLVAAGLLAWSGTTAAFLFAAAAFVGATALVALVRTSRIGSGERVSLAVIWHGLIGGFGHLKATSDARIFTTFAVAASTLLGIDTVLLVVFADRRLRDGTAGYGLLLAGLGVGGLLGATVIDRVTATRHPGRALMVSLGCCAVPTVALVPVHSPLPAFIIEVVSGVGSIATATLASVGFQRSVPAGATSSAVAAFHSALLLGLVAGAVITPLLLDGGGLNVALLIAGIAFPVGGVLSLPRLRRLDERSRQMIDRLAARVGVLEQLAIFDRARRPTLDRLAAAMAEVHIEEGITVVAEGAPADAFYVLVDGEVEVLKADGGAVHHVAQLVGPNYFGEIGLMRQIPRTATVASTSACTMLRIGGDDFLAALGEGSPSAGLAETLVTRLTQLHALGQSAIGQAEPESL